MRAVFLMFAALMLVSLSGCPKDKQSSTRSAVTLKVFLPKPKPSPPNPIAQATTDLGNGVYYIAAEDGKLAAAAIAKLRAEHPGQKSRELEQKGDVGGNRLTGVGAVAATVGWIVIFE